jgi:hypothetical protein
MRDLTPALLMLCIAGILAPDIRVIDGHYSLRSTAPSATHVANGLFKGLFNTLWRDRWINGGIAWQIDRDRPASWSHGTSNIHNSSESICHRTITSLFLKKGSVRRGHQERGPVKRKGVRAYCLLFSILFLNLFTPDTPSKDSRP